ncbi:MAG TPA: carbohydrate porin [Rhizomicrobium sp.]
MRALSLGLLATLMVSGSAFAADDSFQPGITGDWDGTRTQLQDEGWEFQAKGIFEGAWNPSGGKQQSAAGAGELDFAVLGDLGKLIGDDGGKVEAKITDRFGANLVGAAGLDTLMQVQEIYGRGDIWRLTDLSLSQDLFDKKVNVVLGRLDPGSDFDNVVCNFQNLSFCGSPPGNIDGDYWFNAPIGEWGARLKVNATKDIYLEAGAYQINLDNLTNGFSFAFSHGDGALIPFELGWKPELIAGLPGEYQIGGWYSSEHAADVFYDVHGGALALSGLAPQMDSSREGFFLSARQQITGTAPPKDSAPGTDGKGLTVFLNYTQSDERTSLLDRQFAIGAAYKGAIAGRSDDEIALAFGTTRSNPRIGTGEALHDRAGLKPFEPVQDTEYVAELDYRAQVAKGATLTPNLQYITDPGGVSSRDDIVVLGLKAMVSL